MRVDDSELRILVMAASPTDQRAIRVLDEVRQLRTCVRRGLSRQRRLRLDVVRGATVDDILTAMNRARPHILHIAAHGTRDGDLSFLDERGAEALVPVQGLAAAVRSAGACLRMIVLSACYSQAAAAVLVGHVDCTIGMRLAVSDASAIQFTRGFYGALGHGCSVARAHAQGLANLRLRLLPNSGDVILTVREGVAAAEWVPLPADAPA
jgi:CHAT domain-containing protein